jgi:uncharacterized membrane protein YphA (DoxX/SURF4 family)
MKSTKIIYWTATMLFAAFMIFSAIPDIAMTDETKQFMRHLGYPDYFMPFIGIAKLLGSIAILTPGLKKIKEWAYAGLIFDLIGAVYSNIMIDGFQPGLLIMIPVFIVAIVSYLYNQKLNNNPAALTK